MTSSQPTTAMSYGMRIPACCRAFIVATASSSFAQTKASGIVCWLRTCAATSAPERSRKPTFTIGVVAAASEADSASMTPRYRCVIGDGRVSNNDAVHSAGELYRPCRFFTRARHDDDHALTELGGSRLVPHQQFGVVRPDQVGHDDPMSLVPVDGQASCRLKRHVVELPDRGQHAGAGL